MKTTLFQLLQWRGAIGLEAKGIKVTRRSVRTHVARFFGLGGRTPHAIVLQHVEAAIQAAKDAGASLVQVIELS